MKEDGKKLERITQMITVKRDLTLQKVKIMSKQEEETTVERIITLLVMCRSHIVAPTKIILGKKTFKELNAIKNIHNSKALNTTKKTFFGVPYIIGKKDYCYRVWDDVCKDMDRSVHKTEDYIEHCKDHFGMNNFQIMHLLKDEHNETH